VCKSRALRRLHGMRYPIIALAALALTLGCGQKATLYDRDRIAARQVAAPLSEMRLDQTVVVSDSEGSGAPMIIRTGQVSIEVDSIDPAVTRVRNLAKAFGGYIG
jgi:fructose-1,6-bisphosphatase/sedoheptulose 1,7-bisphosphatase-like protein